MGILQNDWVSFLITFFGTLFLIGELLVNARGLFGILGLGFITVFFYSFLSPSMFILMMLIYLIGLILIIIDGKLINDGTLATIGAVCMIIAVGFSSPNWVAGLYGVIGVILGGASSLFFLKAFKRRDMWSKITLIDQLSTEAGYNTMNETYKSLLNEEGVAQTDMRPVGTVQIKGRDYSAVTNGQWISKGATIMVEAVDGTKILVAKKQNNDVK
ncbi:NfeD-like C-terminal, partner-binding [Thalassobacillus cyri]|uniref:NfeD-like C-terminal, partner-binding n=1 Tax=Thalassobacillus cyri TaxID=571932 RepID=A0A1H4FII2_9BACI|nr:NfeD family protein [Thalassobacillus cyri]SEA97106.1 NfeD-like C-terminal, partner-binding [Thalassobacillus cyri]